jgi:ATP-dependent phosphofructokinase / diphosphate-dependent phosphofructokinase
MTPKNAFYAQSGGVSAVINASACGVLETARQRSAEIGKLFAGRNGIIGALTEDLIDTSFESEAAIAALKHTPGAAFGSCRYKLGSIHEHRAQYERLIDVFRAHDIGFFFYNGGGDSQDTAYKVSQLGTELAYPVVCIGIPKTIDNDLPITDCSPGFGSVAKYVATSLREAALDLAAMSPYFDQSLHSRSDGPACRLDNRRLCPRRRSRRRCSTRLAAARGRVR